MEKVEKVEKTGMNVKKGSFYFVDSKNVLTFAALNQERPKI